MSQKRSVNEHLRPEKVGVSIFDLYLAVAVQADPRTVAKVLRGERVRGLTGERIRQRLNELKVEIPEGGKE